jgi:succinyl-CoA synthetase beta subunit
MFSRVVKPLFSRQLTTSVRRYFDLHEYQSKDLMRKYGVNVQRGDIATTAQQAFQVAKDLNVTEGDLILKAQVHAGGRGKGTLCDM